MSARFLTIFLVLFSAGCSGSGPEIIPIETSRVTGIATFQGKPLEDYRVYFYCDAAAAKEPATDRIKPDGSFDLSVRFPGDGAIVGLNKVWFSYDPLLPEEVPGMETGLAPPPAKVKLPEKYLSADTSGITVDVPASGLADHNLELK